MPEGVIWRNVQRAVRRLPVWTRLTPDSSAWTVTEVAPDGTVRVASAARLSDGTWFAYGTRVEVGSDPHSADLGQHPSCDAAVEACETWLASLPVLVERG